MKNKYVRKKIETTCAYCLKYFLKDKSEFIRNNKLDRKNYCSLGCAGKVNTKHLDPYKGNYEPLKIFFGKEKHKDEFNIYVRRFKKEERTLTKDDLKTQWNKQNGICVYSGVRLTHPYWRKNNKHNHITTASLDRIDSSKGYIPGNIQFVSITANHAKNNLTHDEMVEFCKIISKHWH